MTVDQEFIQALGRGVAGFMFQYEHLMALVRQAEWMKYGQVLTDEDVQAIYPDLTMQDFIEAVQAIGAIDATLAANEALHGSRLYRLTRRG